MKIKQRGSDSLTLAPSIEKKVSKKIGPHVCKKKKKLIDLRANSTKQTSQDQ